MGTGGVVLVVNLSLARNKFNLFPVGVVTSGCPSVQELRVRIPVLCDLGKRERCGA
jgi:hypothetical protein